MEYIMNGSHTGHRRTRSALRGWCALGLVAVTGAMVTIADAGSISQSLIASDVATAFVPISPVRILDTRPAPEGPIGVATAGKLGAGATLDVAVAGPGLAVPASATAAMLNITIDQDATLQSFITVWPTGEQRPLTSANNALPNLVASNSMLAKLGNGSISIYNQQGSVNVVVDVVGYLVPAGGGHVLLVGSGAPQPSNGNDGDYYLDASSHELFGPKNNGAWPVGSNLNGARGPAGVGGILGGMTRFNTAALNLPIATVSGTPIPFAVSGPVFGTFAPPTTPASTTTTTAGSTGMFEVTYRLDATASGVGTIQVYVNNVAQGPGTNIAAAIATQAFDSVLVAANQGDAVQLRFTGSIGTLTTTNTSSLVITQLASP
jgi:hypothetical protein